MSERPRVAWLAAGWLGLGLCLAGFGCQMQITFGDPAAHAAKPAPPPALAQAAGGPPEAPLAQAPNGPPQALRTKEADGPAAPVVLTGGPGCGPDGCGPHGAPGEDPGPGSPPTELAKKSLPPYMIEPPDILVIDAVRLVPRPPYVVQPLDVLLLRLAEPLPGQPIEGTYTVSPDGTINLGYSYGVVRVGGLTLQQVEEAVRRQVGRVVKDPQVAVGLAQFRGVQQVRGEHLVRPDGTVSLGTYGCVYVTGLTLCQAKLAIERHLSQFLVDPEISVDVFAYNSKVYYVITDGAGYGQQVYRFPVTGNETVLDAIGNIQGLPAVASTKKMWVARPTPACHGCVQVLPVDWDAIVQGGATGTNWQVFPGDRIYVQSQALIRLDNALAKIIAPVERLFGVTLLGSTTVNSFRRNNNGTNGAAAFIVAR
jgi:polysaccharide export outer membrane protein